MRRSLTILFSLLTLVALVAAACSSDGGGDDSPTDTPPPAADNGNDVDDGDSNTGGEGLSATISAAWSTTVVGEGIKPALALDGEGTPAIAYLFESVGDGFVKFASGADGWSPDTIVEGYFYGPLDLAFDPEGQPNIVYHDHQASGFQQDLGDLTYALRSLLGWQVAAAVDDGHDGWDSTIAIGADGVVRAAGVDPSQFGSSDGVEYYELQDGEWSVTAIGSGPIEYEFNVSLTVDTQGNPALTYYNDRDDELVFASFDGSAWNLEIVASDGNVGKFSSLQFDAEGRPHITFFEELSASTGRVLYAVRDAGAWTVEEIGTLDDVRQGMTGARRNSSLALDATGTPHVVFSDQSGVSYATRTDGVWNVSDVATAGDLPFGQLVSLKVDTAGVPHLAFTELTQNGPLNGLIVYATLG
jgi:hypothetical protein